MELVYLEDGRLSRIKPPPITPTPVTRYTTITVSQIIQLKRIFAIISILLLVTVQVVYATTQSSYDFGKQYGKWQWSIDIPPPRESLPPLELPQVDVKSY